MKPKVTAVLKELNSVFNCEFISVHNETNSHGVITATYAPAGGSFPDMQAIIKEDRNGYFLSGKIFDTKTHETMEIVQ